MGWVRALYFRLLDRLTATLSRGVGMTLPTFGMQLPGALLAGPFGRH